MKKHEHTELSNKKCSCGKLLKKNLVERKETATDCFKCHVISQAGRGHVMHNFHKIRRQEEQDG